MHYSCIVSRTNFLSPLSKQLEVGEATPTGSWEPVATVPKNREAKVATSYAKDTLYWSNKLCSWTKIKPAAIQYKANGQSTKVCNGLPKRCLSL